MMKQLNPLLPTFATRPPHYPVALAMARSIGTFLPPTLVRLWKMSGRGVLIFDEGLQPSLQFGPFFWRDVQAYTAIYLPIDCQEELLWLAVGNWLNYFGGSAGRQQSMSEGYGATLSLEQAAKRFLQTVALGYAEDYFKTKEASVLFARAVLAYRSSPRALSADDPILWRWLRKTLFNEPFWQRVMQENQEKSIFGG